MTLSQLRGFLPAIVCLAAAGTLSCGDQSAVVDTSHTFTEDGEPGQTHGTYMVIERDDEASSVEQGLIAAAGPPRRTIFVNGRGGTYFRGPENARANTSGIVRFTSQMPPYSKGAAGWQQFLSCIKDQYAPFNVEVTDVDPGPNVPHIEAVISGVPQNIGLQQGIGGVAPMMGDCSTINNAIVWVFERVLGTVQSDCEVAAQEISHAIGLDHQLYCPDPMTYLSGCGKKKFKNLDTQCGEFSARPCMCRNPVTGSTATQNSVQFQFLRLGAAPSGVPDAGSGGGGGGGGTPDAGSGGGGGSDGGTDTSPPTVTIESPSNGASLPANTPTTVTVTAADNVGVARVELFWSYVNRALPCDNTSNQGVTCTIAGNTYRWSIPVGSGARTFFATAYDAAGNKASTPSRTVTFGNGPPPPPPGGPEVTISSPVANTSIQRGQNVTVNAAVRGAGVTTVRLRWEAPNGLAEFPMADPDNDGTYSATVVLRADAVAGARNLTVTARNQNAQSGSAKLTLNVP